MPCPFSAAVCKSGCSLAAQYSLVPLSPRPMMREGEPAPAIRRPSCLAMELWVGVTVDGTRETRD